MLSVSIATSPISDDFSTIIMLSFLATFSPFLHEVSVLIFLFMLSFSHFIFFSAQLIFHVKFSIFIVIMLFVSFDLRLIFMHAYGLTRLSYVLIILNVPLPADFFIPLIISTFLLPPQHFFESREVIELLQGLLEVGELAMELFFFLLPCLPLSFLRFNWIIL